MRLQNQLAVAACVLLLGLTLEYLLSCSSNQPKTQTPKPVVPSAQPVSTSASPEQKAQGRPELSVALEKETVQRCKAFVNRQSELFVFKSGPRFDQHQASADQNGVWVTLPFTTVTTHNKRLRSVAFCNLGQYGQFQSLTGTDEADMPEWWKPADHPATRGINRAAEQLSSARTANEKVAKTLYMDQSTPYWPKYKTVVMNAAKVVAEQPQCAEVTHAELHSSCLDANSRPKCSPAHAKINVECRIADAWKSHKWYASNPYDIWYVENGKVVGEFGNGVI